MPSGRYMSLDTYVPESQLLEVLDNHKRSLAGYAYILHDKDDAEPHRHVLLCLLTSWTEDAIKSWFRGCDGNTLSQVCRSPPALLRYFLHTDDPDKYQYQESDIVQWGTVPFADQRSTDTSYLILMDMICGCGVSELVRKYGRDYLYHITHYERAYYHITGREYSQPPTLRALPTKRGE